MGKVVALLAAFVFTLSLAGSALAQETQKTPGADAPKSAPSADPGKSEMGKSPETKPAPAARDMEKGKPAAGKSAAGGDFRGRHSMRGEVTKLDTAKGMITVKTDEGDLNLHVPPAALGGIKEGDRVEVQLAIRPAAGKAATGKPATGKAPGASKTDDAGKSSPTPGARPGVGPGQSSGSPAAPEAPKTQ